MVFEFFVCLANGFNGENDVHYAINLNGNSSFTKFDAVEDRMA